MLNFYSLYSGSTGNSLLIESEHSRILVDAGVSAKKIETALTSLSIDIHSLDAIVVTHEHSDHVQSLGTLSKKYELPVYANVKTWDAMPSQKDKIAETKQQFFTNQETFEINDLIFTPFDIPHDAANPCGFNIQNGKDKISIATDLGHMTTDIISRLEGSKFVLLESNYDPEVLKCCSYPYPLKMRIAGPNGHLSNPLAGKTISHLIPTGLKQVMLGHLSKENNFPELAYNTVLEELAVNGYTKDDIAIQVASRTNPSNVVCIQDRSNKKGFEKYA